jgi:hypothetical protein
MTYSSGMLHGKENLIPISTKFRSRCGQSH